MRVVIDARPLSQGQMGGFRTYLRALSRGLRERAEAGEGNEELLFYLDRPLSSEAATELPPNAQTCVLSPNRLQTDLRLFAAQVRHDAPDLVQGTMNYLPSLPPRVPTVLTLHDAMGIKRYPWDARTPRTPRERFINRYWAVRTRASARSADQIISVSQASADECADALKLPRDRFTVVYNGLPPNLCSPTIVREPDIILAIESPDPRKNLDLLYRALTDERARFGARPPRLEIVCTSAVAAARAEARGQTLPADISVRLLTGLSDTALAEAYARATVFAWPSRWEGFGLPPLEAMQSGCAVVSSSAPAMPEILGDVPLYADPDDPAAFADAVARLLADPEEQIERGQRGRAHAAAFTCRRMADETVAVWHKVLSA